MKNLLKSIRHSQRKADTLVEVIMAIFIVVIGSGAATVLIVSAMQANTFNKDNLIALNLAVEGVEAVRNIRDTNWIKFSFDKARCWNMHPDSATGDDCLAPNLIEAGAYTVDLLPDTYSWTLTYEGTPLDLNGNETANYDYKLVFIDLDEEADSNSNGSDLDDTDLMISREAATMLSPTGETRFYRMVNISYPAPDVMNVESVVQWRTSSPVLHQIRIFSSLTNFNRVKTN